MVSHIVSIDIELTSTGCPQILYTMFEKHNFTQYVKQSSQLKQYSPCFSCERLRPVNKMLLRKLNVLEISLEKELTAKCLVETCTNSRS